MSKKRIVPGVVISIPIDDKFVIGLVLHKSRLFKNGMIVGFFDLLFTVRHPSCDDLNSLSIIESENLPNYCSTVAVSSGQWSYVGKCEQLLQRHPMPILRQGGFLYKGDEVIGRTELENKSYRSLIGWGNKAVENELRQHFNLPKLSD